MGQDAICGVADCFVSGRGNVDSGCRFVVQVADGFGAVCCPSVPHGDGCMKEVSRVNRRVGEVQPNGRQVLLIPDSGD